MFGRKFYEHYLSTAMNLFQDVYLHFIRSGVTTAAAYASASAAAENYMTQYLTFRERGL